MASIEERIIAPLTHRFTPTAHAPISRELSDSEALLPTGSPIHRRRTAHIVQWIVVLNLVVAISTTLCDRIELLGESRLRLRTGVGWLC